MQVKQEFITVLAEPETREIAVVMAGLRFTFSADEADLLADGIASALTKLGAKAAVGLPSPSAVKPMEMPQGKVPARLEPEPPLKDTIAEIEKTLIGATKKGG